MGIGTALAQGANTYGTKNFSGGSMLQAGVMGAAAGVFVFGGAAALPFVAGPGAAAFNKVATAGIDTSEYTYSGTALKTVEERPYQFNGATSIIQKITTYAPNATSYKPHLTSWTVPGEWNASSGVWELTLDQNTQQITHFMFKSL